MSEPVEAAFQISDVRAFFEILFPDLRDGYVEFRSIGIFHNIESHFYGSTIAAVTAATHASEKPDDDNIYFGVCPRSERKGDKSAIRVVNALWADQDAKDFPGGKPEALRRLLEHRVPPTIVVDSGNGYHAYWRLKAPFAISGPESVALIERHLKTLARALGADEKAAELARILRVPGTLNLKDMQRVLRVEIVEIHPERLWDLSDFPCSPVSDRADHPNSNLPGWISQALDQLADGNRNSTFTKLAGRLNRDGWSGAEILALLGPHAQRTEFPREELETLIAGICKRYPRSQAPNPRHCDQEPEPRQLLVVPLGELLSHSAPEIDWQVAGILPVEGEGILAGPPACGKTWMLADLAIEVSRGGSWMGQFPTKKGTVLCIDEESPSGLLPGRYRKLLHSKGISAESVDVHFCNGQGFSFSRPGDVTRLREILTRIKPALVIVDSLIRVHSADENSASEMSAVFAVVKALARDFHCAFLFADHMRKGKPGETGLDQMVRGSTDKAAFVDTLLAVKKTEVGIVVEHAKSRFAEALPGFAVIVEDSGREATSVKCVGDAKALQEEHSLKLAKPHVETAVEGGDWVPRKEIVEEGKKAGVKRKAIDAVLKDLVKDRKLERDDRRPEGGKGNKQAFYRLPGGCEVIPFPARNQNGEATETGAREHSHLDGSPADDPVPHSLTTNTGETGTGSVGNVVGNPTVLMDPIPHSPSTSSRETGNGVDP